MNLDSKKDSSILLILVFTIIIDVMGFGLVLPLFPTLFLNSNATMLPLHSSEFVRFLYYAMAFSVWPIGAFFGTPFLGNVSDKYGRRKILALCLFMEGFSYVLCALAVLESMFIIFILARILQGFFGGSYDIAQAATADISTHENKARNMGWITFAVAMGLIVGPAISGFTSTNEIVSWFTLDTPFWIAAILAVANAFFIFKYLPETTEHLRDVKVSFFKVFSSFMFIFSDKRVRRIGLVYFWFIFGWGLYIIALPLILESVFLYDSKNIGFVFVILGLGNAVTILFVQKYFLKHYAMKFIFIYSFILGGAICLGVFLLPFALMFWITPFFISGICILGYSSFLAISSNAVGVDEQGILMGGLGAIASIAFGVSGFALSYLAILDPIFPILAAGIMFLLSSYLFIKYKSEEA